MKKEQVKIVGELQKYKQLYLNKQEELESTNSGMTERIEKQYNEKNVLITEINTNNIELKKLKEEVNLHKSEKEALKIILREKENMVEHLNSSIAQVEIKRKKIEGYEVQLRETQAALGEIEVQTANLKLETDRKDAIIQNCNKKITSLEAKLVQYQEEFGKLEKSVILERESYAESSFIIKEAQQECQ
jgi:chromosome segregation ATPase